MSILKDWLGTFGMVVIKPIPQTFIAEAQKANNKFLSAVGWLIFIGIGMYIHTYVFTSRTYPPLAVIGIILYLSLIFLIFVSCVHLLYQRLFRRKRYFFPELLYLFVGIFVPFAVVNLFVSSSWGVFGEILFWTTSIYPLILMVVALKAITKLNLWQSLATIFLSIVLALAGFFCLPAFIFSITQSVPGIF